jgi:glycosyltransferase involved in cell wall biosynthesis
VTEGRGAGANSALTEPLARRQRAGLAVSVSEPYDLELSIVIPCLNEEETLAGCVREAQAALAAAGVTGEVIVADNGSTDRSREIAAELGARVVPVAEKGYGAALQGGVTASRGRFVLMGDADGSYDFGHAPRFLAALRGGADLVMGNRFAGGIQPGAMPWKNRYLGNPLLSGLGRLFFRCPVRDFHCGLRAFRRAAYDRLALQTSGMEFASEMVIKATLLGHNVVEVPTVLRPDGRSRPPHLRPWRDGWRHLRFMLLYSPRWLFLFPGLVAMGAGLAGTLWLLPGPRTVGVLTFDVHTLVYAVAAVLIGFQSVSFAILSRVYAMRAGLLPPQPAMERWFRWITLESGVVVGAVLLVAGLAVTGLAVLGWQRAGFGPLDPQQTLRWVVPGALGLALGTQVILLSFFLSVLGLRLRHDPAP